MEHLATLGDDAKSHHNQGLAHYKAGEPERALPEFAHAAKLAPRDPFYWNSLCWYGCLAGHILDALNAGERAVKLGAGDANMRDSRGLARALNGDYKGAIEDFSFFVNWSKRYGL